MGGPEGRRRLSAARIVVTGASGWVGRASLERLSEIVGPALRERAVLLAGSARQIALGDGSTLAVAPLADLERTPGEGALLAHFAFLTRDRLADLGPDRYIAANEAITAGVAAWIRRARPAAVLAASSGAVDGAGDLDVDPYGALKRREEQALAAACEQVGARLCVVRIFNVSGPHMRRPERYALGSMIRAVLASEPVHVRAPHPVIRSYVAIRELLDLGLAVLGDEAAEPHVVFDSAGQEEVEVGELAVRVARALGRPGARIVRPPTAAEPVDRYVGDGEAIGRLRTRYAIAHLPLDEQIRQTASAWSARTPRQR